MEFNHEPVLLNECIHHLNIKADGIYVDGTLGGAGHSLEIAKNLSENGLLIGIDRDIYALESAKQRLKDFNNVKYVNDNHDNIEEVLEELQVDRVDGILLDLGVSSYQLDEKARGFSYMKEAPLDMRMDQAQELTARKVINEYTEEELARVIYEYGEEKFSRQIARNICKYREEVAIETTTQLVEILERSIPSFNKVKGGHPAKRTFQAIRIEVNNELEPLYNTIVNSVKYLKAGGRLCVITFHSLEDRPVKQAYKELAETCNCSKELPYCVCNQKPEGIIVTRKPVLPSEEEMQRNSRSKSAKLRVFQKCTAYVER
ncbi:MAG: 16S rRNA (cytosine(1402)-N(4))-methyltransferase RsmH [Oscillospiraceae bacterium]|nr:16S rRNA (cytosine(1402)-N(4))-methyltransferase RsmH [Oscillospiraceae bacterium]